MKITIFPSNGNVKYKMCVTPSGKRAVTHMRAVCPGREDRRKLFALDEVPQEKMVVRLLFGEDFAVELRNFS